MTTLKLVPLGDIAESQGLSLSRKHPLRHAPKGGWEEHTFYLVEVAFSNNNPVHRHIFYTGFISKDGRPNGYNNLITCSEDSGFSDAVYLYPIERLFNRKEKKMR